MFRNSVILIDLADISASLCVTHGQHAVFCVSHLLLLCFCTGTAKACIDWSSGKYLLVIECSTLHTVLKMALVLCSLLLSTVTGTHFSDHVSNRSTQLKYRLA